MHRRLVAPTLWVVLTAGCTPGPMDAVHAGRWTDAERQAAGAADPVAVKLVAYLRFLSPNGGSAREIAAFIDANAGWPNQAQLERRRQEALANETDQGATVEQCDRAPLQLASALLHCASAYTAAGRPDDSARVVRRAWAIGTFDLPGEYSFLARYGAILAPEDQEARFNRLVSGQPDAAARQALRLEPGARALAQARLAFRGEDPAAEAKLAAMPPVMRDDAGLMLDHAAWLRRHDRLDEARELWLARGSAAQHAAATERVGAYWTERNQLARRLLRAGDNRGAYAIINNDGPGGAEQRVEADFLAGYIALRRLHDPAAATAHFRALAARSDAALTQSRAYFWLGCADAETGADPADDYRRSAAFPVTFYGQLAALRLNPDQTALAARIRAARDPGWTSDQAVDFGGTELARASALMVAWGDPRHAHGFLLSADQQAPSPAERALAAHLGERLGMPDVAVAIARRMGRDGLMLPQAGWPTPFNPTNGTPDPAIVLGLMRQESSFDVQAVSPSGARGLMQLMPATAQAVSRQTGQPTPVASLTQDPDLNMRLGTAYLRSLLAEFGALPLALAAYNAGPHRVGEWLAENGDPRTGAIDMLDWIELIPFSETRNYVQRVLENAVIYGVRTAGAAPVRLATFDR